MDNKKLLTYAAIVVGVLFILLGVYYFITPAGSLAHFVPGFAEGSSKVHVKHALGAVILGLGCFAFAWFQSGKKSMGPKQDTQQNPN